MLQNDTDKVRAKMGLASRTLNALAATLDPTHTSERLTDQLKPGVLLVWYATVLGLVSIFAEVERLLGALESSARKLERDFADVLYERNRAEEELRRLRADMERAKTFINRALMTERAKFMASGAIMPKSGGVKLEAIKRQGEVPGLSGSKDRRDQGDSPGKGPRSRRC